MKKLIIPFLSLLVFITSCQKEDDLITPIQQNPTTNTNIITTNTDTLTTNGDTIVTVTDNGDTLILVPILEAFENDYLVATNSNSNDVTVVPPSATFIGAGNNYTVKRAEFDMNCSELTQYSSDTSYSYVSTNQQGPWGNGIVEFNNDGTGVFATPVYPRNATFNPAHAYNFSSIILYCDIDYYSYTPGMLTMNLRALACNGSVITWTVNMAVTEYSDGSFSLSIDQDGNGMGIVWNSHLKVVL